MRFVSLLAATAALAVHAFAQPAPETAAPADIAMLQSCVDARETNAERALCIGAASRVCAEQMGDSAETTAGLVICAHSEALAWSAILIEAAEGLRLHESETQLILLEQYLENGELWAATRCAYAASQYEGGSLARVLAAQCQRDDVASRAIELRARLREMDAF